MPLLAYSFPYDSMLRSTMSPTSPIAPWDISCAQKTWNDKGSLNLIDKKSYDRGLAPQNLLLAGSSGRRSGQTAQAYPPNIPSEPWYG